MTKYHVILQVWCKLFKPRYDKIVGSTSPDLDPIMTPERGVNPILVSTPIPPEIKIGVPVRAHGWFI